MWRTEWRISVQANRRRDMLMVSRTLSQTYLEVRRVSLWFWHHPHIQLDRIKEKESRYWVHAWDATCVYFYRICAWVYYEKKPIWWTVYASACLNSIRVPGSDFQLSPTKNKAFSRNFERFADLRWLVKQSKEVPATVCALDLRLLVQISRSGQLSLTYFRGRGIGSKPRKDKCSSVNHRKSLYSPDSHCCLLDIP